MRKVEQIIFNSRSNLLATFKDYLIFDEPVDYLVESISYVRGAVKLTGLITHYTTSKDIISKSYGINLRPREADSFAPNYCALDRVHRHLLRGNTEKKLYPELFERNLGEATGEKKKSPSPVLVPELILTS